MDVGNICCIVDAQGFLINNNFYINEVSIINDDLNICVKTHSNFDDAIIGRMEYKTIKYTKNNINGLTFQSFSRINGPMFIFNTYNLIKTFNLDIVGIKNTHLEKVLDELEIPYINLEVLGCPSIDRLLNLYNLNKVCSNHIYLKNYKNARCAKYKAICLWKWVEEEYTKKYGRYEEKIF